MNERPFYAPTPTHNAMRIHLPGAIPITMGSSSLDNTLRVRCIRPTSWCLLDARIQGIANGFFHGETCVFAEDGTLIATASQSGVLPRQPHGSEG